MKAIFYLKFKVIKGKDMAAHATFLLFIFLPTAKLDWAEQLPRIC
jgi:hypothetical protein